ncbi:MAG: ASCH domain-containing protein [Erysipelotrichaceae bacterium]|nr:ASCH domain-containing protein [Erysipelotrichaceae bacterium]
MSTYKMKIRDLYIDPILEGIKKHEFRLNTEERRDIRIGDYLILISKQDNERYAKVIVSQKQYYDSWEEVIDDYWEEEFNSFFETKEKMIKEVYKYYSKEEINEYGIICYEIRNYKTPEVKRSSVLLDTNILIDRESSNVTLPFEEQKLFKRLDDLKCLKTICKDSIEEVKKHGNKEIREVVLSKANSYNILDKSTYKDDLFTEVISSHKDKKNGSVDNDLILQVYNDSCSYLLTNDRFMLKKAEELFIRDRVKTPEELLDIIEKNYPELTDYNILNIRLKRFSAINLSDRFFDSLKESYSGFSDWYKKKTTDNESAYVFESENDIYGFLYLKTEDINENYSDIKPAFSPKKRLKIGTFKTDYPGFRIGERFLKIVFDNAVKQNVDEIYITMFEKEDDNIAQLMKMLKEWGFVYWGTKGKEETVLVKDMKNYNYTKDPKYNFPLIKGSHNVYFLPIEAKYHTDLFPDMYLENEDLKLYEGNKAHRFAMEKIYATGNIFSTINPGDILLIYRMGERWPKKYTSVVTGMVILESSDTPKTKDEYLGICKNKSVFEKDELDLFYNEHRRLLTILNYKSFSQKVTLGQLREAKIVEEGKGPRSLSKVSKNDYRKILEMAGEKHE